LLLLGERTFLTQDRRLQRRCSASGIDLGNISRHEIVILGSSNCHRVQLRGINPELTSMRANTDGTRSFFLFSFFFSFFYYCVACDEDD
jgi:hypothetical protein